MKPAVLDIDILCEDEDCIPSYASEGAAGADVRANIHENMAIPPGESRLIPTGVRVAVPQGYEIQVRSRSGLALKHQIAVLNSPGTIDSDYRGEIGVILMNHGQNEFIVEPKMRIAQIVLAPVLQARFLMQAQLTDTCRGSGGFGHTGIK